MVAFHIVSNDAFPIRRSFNSIKSAALGLTYRKAARVLTNYDLSR